MYFKKIIILISISFCLLSQVFADSKIETKTSPNYLIILVHGVNTPGFVWMGGKGQSSADNGSDVSQLDDKYRGFGDLLGYLRNNLGLDGYVYYYTFSQRDGKISNQARELGDPNYSNPAVGGSIMNHKGLTDQPDITSSSPLELRKYLRYPLTNNSDPKIVDVGSDGKANSWIKQAREDFKKWFYDFGPGSKENPKRYPTDIEIPSKYIIIAHSMGGLVAREYLSSDYYQGSVEALVTIDSQHLGSNGAKALKRIFEFYNGREWIDQYGQMLGLTIAMLMANQDDLAIYTGFCAIAMPIGRAVIDQNYTKGNMGWYPDQPGVQDMAVDSNYLRELNSKPFINSSNPLRVRLVSGRGIPTPSGDLPVNRYLLGAEAIQTVFSSSYLNDLPLGGKLMAIYMSVLLGAIINQDGDIYGTNVSQLGEGLSSLKAPNIDLKKYTYTFVEDSDVIADAIIGASAAIGLANAANLITGGPGAWPLKWAIIVAAATTVTKGIEYRYSTYLAGHGLILKKVYEEHIIDKALEDFVALGGNATTAEAKSSIPASSIDSPTSGYDAPQQAFALLSNKNKDGSDAGNYHTVTIETVTESSNHLQAAPIEIDGQKRWVSGVMVKETPTAIKGVINTFLPKKLKSFEYSENFAAWKPVPAVDEWGNFTVKDLKLAEGQNVIAFKAESWIGNKMNQILTITLNTIPMVASEFSPLPGTYLKNNMPTISGKFAKSSYSAASLESIAILNAKILSMGQGSGSKGQVEIDILAETEVTIGGEAYNKYLIYKYKPKTPLLDGEYTLIVNVSSNVGNSSAVTNFIVDTQSPTITMTPIAPYSPRAPSSAKATEGKPATIRYSVSDEASPLIKSVTCNLYDSNNNFVTNISTADSLSLGDNYFNWDGTYTPLPLGEGIGVRVVDGSYIVKVKAFDLAGNMTVAEQPITIDSTPPVISKLTMSPNPMTSNSQSMSLEAKTNEHSTVIIKLINKSKNNATTAYLAQANGLTGQQANSFSANYSWQYADMFSKGPEDGIYRIEVTARDDAGNESSPTTIESFRIDRTPPEIYGQITSPYVLSNVGVNAYKTTLSYRLSNNLPSPLSGEGGPSTQSMVGEVKIKLYNQTTGVLVNSWPDAPSSTTDTNYITWNGSDPVNAKGAYKFQIIATDDVGNTGISYATCVKDGIAPTISYPSEDNAQVSGMISIRGTAMDPDWTNDKSFKQYAVFYKKGQKQGRGEGAWETLAIEVPLVNRNPADAKNLSIRPLQNDSTLAYLNTNVLENGTYTVLVIVDEDGGDSISTARVIEVKNDAFSAQSNQNPYAKLNTIPNSVDFTDPATKLPISFLNSVKPANVYVEILKPSPPALPVRQAGPLPQGERGGGRTSEASIGVGEGNRVVFYKYFPNVAGAPFTGRCDYKPGSDLGYFIWNDTDGYHLRMSTNGKQHKFSGSIVSMGGNLSVASLKQGVVSQNNMISWDQTISRGETGFDFSADGRIIISPAIDADPKNPETSGEKAYLGASKFTQKFLPIVIDGQSQRLVNLASMANSSQPTANSGAVSGMPLAVSWDGKYDTGSYVDSGSYIIRIVAEGADGVGVATDEAAINIVTPYNLSIKEVSPTDKKFSTLGMPDRVSVFYNVSKDSIVSASVYDSAGNFKAKILDGQEVLGSPNPNNPLSFYWKGNYPDPDSRRVVSGGKYRIEITATAKDGSASKKEIIDDINVSSFTNSAGSGLAIDPIGQETMLGREKIHLAEGESPYYVETSATGEYHAPKDFSYTLSATGKTLITAYPYVPFAGLMHRGFRQVDVLVKAKMKVNGYVHTIEWSLTKGFYHEKRGGRDQIHNNSKTFGIRENGDPYYIEDDTFTAGGIWRNWNEEYPGLENSEAKIEIYSKDGSFLLDSTEAWFKDSDGFVKTNKGIFEVRLEGARQEIDGAGHAQRYDAKVYVKLPDNSPIAYSRLTNRFVPWVGFINAKSPASDRIKDYSSPEIMLDVQKGLGFPGGKFFNDPTAKLSDPFPSSLADDLKKKWNATEPKTFQAVAEAIENIKNDSSLKNYSGETYGFNATDGYNSYLSDEHIEFIPITAPEGGAFEYNNASPIVKISTNLTYAGRGDGNKLSPFEFSWPLVDSEKTDKYPSLGTAKRDELIKDPQKYTGTSKDGTFWDLDNAEWNSKKFEANNSTIIGGNLAKYDKIQNKTLWDSEKTADNLLIIPTYVDKAALAAVSNNPEVAITNPNLSKSDFIHAEGVDKAGVNWSTSDDTNLTSSNGLIKNGPLVFNENTFLGTRILNIYDLYKDKLSSEHTSPNALKFTFLNRNPFNDSDTTSPIDNPNLSDFKWSAIVKDKTGGINKDISLEATNIYNNASQLDDTLSLKLNLSASESRYVEIRGSTPGAYDLMYFDGNVWKTIFVSSEAKSGTLAWWNVSRLNGKYTVLLRSNSNSASTDISIGTLVKNDGASHEVYSTYRRAQLLFPANAFTKDELVTITPVSMKEIYVRNRPIILTSGPIVEIKPSPYKFKTPSTDGVEGRPTLRFVYTLNDLTELKLWKPEDGVPHNLPWNIHQVTASGDLQIIDNNHQSVEENNGEKQYVFSGPLNHFSTYALLPGKFHLSAPMVFADRYITNKNYATIYGTAEPGSELRIFVSKEPRSSFAGSVAIATKNAGPDKGEFRFENIDLLADDGVNYVYVVSSPQGNPEVMTFSDVEITKDTIPPIASSSQNLYAFSPNGDGKYDTVDYLLKTNENGKIRLQLAADGKQLLNQELSAEANKEIKLTWSKDGFDIYKRNSLTGIWDAVSRQPIAVSLSDGDYQTTVYSIDEAGNISNNVSGRTVVDTTPPKINDLTALPNPFTPNGDGVKDTTTFKYNLSEPAYATLGIYREDGGLFRSYMAPTGKFAYPTDPLSFLPLDKGEMSRRDSGGSWAWDGRGSRNELLGGTYKYFISVEDNVGNVSTSEIKSVVVDREPTLIPYAYADPDPFSAISDTQNYTNIKYYISRDNVEVQAVIMGKEGKPIKNLVFGETKNKGEHSVKWYGDYIPGYDGPIDNEHPDKLADGAYQFKIYANDPYNSTKADISNTVLIDNTPPFVTVYPVKVDRINRKATLRYYLPENSSVEVLAYQDNGTLIKKLVESELEKAGEHLIYWTVPQASIGKTYITVTAVDRAKNTDKKTTEIFSLDVETPLSIANAKASPSPFTPNGDGKDDASKLDFKIVGGEPPYKINVNVLNPGGATIKKLIVDESHDDGNVSIIYKPDTVLTDGKYSYSINVVDAMGASADGTVDTVLISTKPTISISSDLTKFSPNNDGVKDTITFNYSIDYPVAYETGNAQIKIEILDPNLQTILTKNFSNTPGSYTYVWDGKPNSGSTITPGNYFARISAIDPLLTSSDIKTISFACDNSNPIMSIISLSPSPFSPDVNGRNDQTVLSYSLSKGANVTVEVRAKDGSLVKRLISSQWTDAYAPTASLSIKSKKLKALAVPTIVWDGSTSSADSGLRRIVPDGIYKFYIDALDDAGNAYEVTQDVAVDDTKPLTPEASALPSHTNAAGQNFIGTAETGSLVEVYDNGSLVASSKAVDGEFNIPISLLLGINEIKTRAIDPAGNISDYSKMQTATYETDAPIISNIQISPNPAKAGPLSISFGSSKTLLSTPEVLVNGNAAKIINNEQLIINNNVYDYIYNVSSSDAQGSFTIKVIAEDLSSNISTTEFKAAGSSSFIIDTVNPTISNVDIKPKYAKLGSRITIDPSVSEDLLNDPIIRIGDPLRLASKESSIKYSDIRTDYSYSYIVGTVESEGLNLVTIEAVDLAGNASQFTGSTTIDRVIPQISNLSYSQNPAKAGELTLTFNVSEPLLVAPTVEVTQNGASTQFVPEVGGLWSKVGDQVTAKYTVFASSNGVNDGTAEVKVSTTDLAGNSNLQKYTDLIVDTQSPVFSNLKCDVNNPDFSKYAKAGSVATITFNSSEKLQFNPSVKINGNTASYSSGPLTLAPNSFEYTHQYMVGNSDVNGQASVSIDGFDHANNEGAYNSQSASETFIIDLVNPTVNIDSSYSLIANPSPFSTNTNPDGTDIPRFTTLKYGLSEPSYVTVKVYKVPDGKKAFIASDFASSNYVYTLVSGVWKDAGLQSVQWNGEISSNKNLYDLNNDGYVDTVGEYAFIVEGKDRAGNLTLKKWGGTVWVQNNVLTLKGPDQLDFATAKVPTPEGNPDPHYFSPNGNSPTKTTKLYFIVDNALNPVAPDQPQKIEAQEFISNTKAVGKYSVKVYSDAGLSNLIRIVTPDATVQSSSLGWAVWDGKNDAWQFVADGTYYLDVDVKDYANDQAVNNHLTRSVVVDNTAPNKPSIIADPSHTPKNAWSTHNTPYLSWVDPGDSGGSGVISYQQQLDGGAWQAVSSPWHLGVLSDGMHIIRVKAIDKTGNVGAYDEAVFNIDTTAPNFNSVTVDPSHTPTDNWSSHNSPYIAFSVSDAASGVSYVQGFIDGISQGNISSPYHPTIGDGTHTIKLRVYDTVGLSGDSGTFNFKIDTTPPNAPAISTNVSTETWINNNKPVITWSNPGDAGSGVDHYVGYIDGADQGTVATKWQPTITDGTHTVYVKSVDAMGLTSSASNAMTFKIDTTAPNAPSLSISTPTGTWTNQNNPTISWSNPGDAGSGVDHYVGYIDGNSQGNVSSPWKPTISEGAHTLSVEAFDGVGLMSSSAIYSFKIDKVKPSITPPSSPQPFNPYVDGSKTLSFSVTDPAPSSGGLTVTAQILKTDSTAVEDLTVTGNNSADWNGINNSGDYVNEGDYKLKIMASDSAGNSTSDASCIVAIQDDQRITNNPADSNSPYLVWNQGTNLTLKWIEGWNDETRTISESTANVWNGDADKDAWFYINFNGSQVTLSTQGDGGGDKDSHIYYANSNVDTSTLEITWQSTLSLNQGWYRLHSHAHTSSTQGYGWAGATAVYQYRWYNQYLSQSNNLGQTWTNSLQSSSVDNYPNPNQSQTQIAKNGSTWHKIYLNSSNLYHLYYQRSADGGISWSTAVPINGTTNMCSDRGGIMYPTITVDSNNNTYVAWTDFRDYVAANGKNPVPGDNYEIYFQKIPSNFAPVSANATSKLQTNAVNTASKEVSALATAKPTLLEPADGSTVKTIRPTFKWTGIRGITNYKLSVGTLAGLPVSPLTKAFSKNITQSEATPSNATDPTIAYSINEFDEGLSKGTWYWKVSSNPSTTLEASSDIWSFTVDPPLSMTGVANYPNPFNPNKERTKIRYRLGKSADEAKIRIYDITGSLVRELDGTTNAEGSSIWDKYNDVLWDGRNGRGDIVMNGIYPFDVIATLNGQSVMGKGKIAVLK
ncbi:hypothetical protein HZC34_04775 [Candidatus Saganbacteria bacterium]|nr:hypothetical protein [Candidatus Saganbacteria bacterium]